MKKEFHWIVGAMLLASSAQAGEVLRLKSGNVRMGRAAAPIGPSLRVPFGQEARYFVLQFGHAIGMTEIRALEAAGLQIQSYLPDDAFLVSGSVSQVELVRATVPSVNAASVYLPEWRLSPNLFDRAVAKRSMNLLVTLGKGEVPAQVASVLRSLPGVLQVNEGSEDLVVRAKPAALTVISQIEGVTWVEPLPALITWDFPVQSDDGSNPPNPSTPPAAPTPPPVTGFESGTKLMNFDAAWRRGFTGKGQAVSISDTGCDVGKLGALHGDLENVTNGYAIGFGAMSWEDPMGHGTHVIGSVGGTGRMSGGQIRGGAHEAKLMMNGLWSPIMNNLAFPQDFSKIIGGSLRDGALINTNSWGNPNALGVYDSLANKIDAYTFDHPELLVLFAAGNSGQDIDADGHIDPGSVSSPATAKNVLTVGASENTISAGGIQKSLGELRDGAKKWGVEPLKSDKLSDNAMGVAAFSSRGPTSDGRIKPEIVAPGTNIVSTRSHHPTAQTLWGEYDSEYLWAGGTSMATPLTAGAAAVARQFLVEKRGMARPSGALVKATLIHTAFDLYPGQYGEGAGQELKVRRPNSDEGYGRVDMDKATGLSDETQLVDDAVGVETGEQRSISVQVAQGGSIRATLTYTDAPAAASAQKALVNDLDLMVVTPSGETRTLADHVNNTEMLELTDLVAGTYQVVVKGVSVPQGKQGHQPYALVVSR